MDTLFKIVFLPNMLVRAATNNIMKFLNLLTALLISSIAFIAGCTVEGQADPNAEPLPLSTRSYATPSPDELLKKFLERKATLSKDLSKDWKKSQRRLGSDDWIDVCFVDSNIGWIVSIKGDRLVPLGGGIFKTEDGGRTWRRIPLKLANHSFISNVSFIDKSKGWLVIQTLGRDATKMQILETSDGGETWTPGFSLDDAIVSRMAFNRQGEGWVIGIKAKAVYMHDQKNLVLYTHNFGKSWSDVTPGSATKDKGNDRTTVLFEDVFTDIFLEDGSSGVTSLSRDGKISFTADNGSTWKILSKLDLQERNSQGFSKILKLGDGGFVAVSSAHGPHGTWSSITAVVGDDVRKYRLLSRVVITDMQLLASGEVIASGFMKTDRSETYEVVSAVVLTTSDFSEWKILFEIDGGSKYGCELNKMFRRGDGYYFVGTDGLLVTMDKNL
jgi:photosystem II stability/assembly factor-like uncharacterized protein